MVKLSLNDIKNSYPKAYNFIINHDMFNLVEQRYELGDGEYVNIESYNTYDFSQRRYESHKKYKDLQVILIGRENIIVEPINNLTVSEEYNPNKDIMFYENNVRGTDNYLEEGEMLLLDSQDGHMPCISINESVHVKKAVFKFLV